MFFEKSNKIDKTLVKLTEEKKREKIQITNSRKERGDITANTMHVKRIVKGYYEQLYAYKCDYLDEM